MLYDLTDEPLLRLTIARTRRAAVRGVDLAVAHREVGRILAREVARSLPLERVTLDHVAGASTDVGVEIGAEPVVIAMLRSGLFVAEGIRESLPDASFVLHRDGDPIESIRLRRRVVCLVDAVINTGASIRRALGELGDVDVRACVVVSLVAYGPTLASLVADYPDVDFVVGRVSHRSYPGRGPTDTGARLFGTTAWED